MSFASNVIRALALALLLVAPLRASVAQVESHLEISQDDEGAITLVARDVEVGEIFQMLTRSDEVSIVVGEGVEGRISVSLFDAPMDEAIAVVAQAAGYGVDRRDGAYVIVDFDELGLDTAGGVTKIRNFRVQYTDTEAVKEILEKHLSRHGVITALEERRMLIVEDLPDFLDRLAAILEEVDRQPKQILLEAKVLEIGLEKNDVLGIDWSRVTSINGAELNIGVRGLTSGSAPGFFASLVSDNLEGAIEALTDQGRVRALATPRLLSMEHKEAEVLVGSRLGYRVTTTINQVTTESVEFIESGVILRFIPSVDRQGRILLSLHPEVSTGIISDGVPSETTTEVTTQLLVEDGARIFIGGLIRDSATEGRRGVPFLSRIPVLGLLFARSEWNYQSTETVVLVRATVQGPSSLGELDPQIKQFDRYVPMLNKQRHDAEDDLDQPWSKATVDDEQVESDDFDMLKPEPQVQSTPGHPSSKFVGPASIHP